jgi:hypothetical protein
MWRRRVRAIFEKAHSIRLSQERLAIAPDDDTLGRAQLPDLGLCL